MKYIAPISILLALTLSSRVIGDNARVLFLLVLTALVSILVAVRYLLSIQVKLLSNVMDASRLEVEADIDPAQIESVSIQEMIQSVLNLLEPRVTQEQREVDLYIPPDLHVRAEPGRLRQVLLNISINALKYSPPPTPIAFSAQIATDSHSAVISVTDSGKGIAPEDQSRVFQRFVRLERDRSSSTPGSGLGLYISYRLIEAMGGKIWIESQGIAGEGTNFHIQLPMGSWL